MARSSFPTGKTPCIIISHRTTTKTPTVWFGFKSYRLVQVHFISQPKTTETVKRLEKYSQGRFSTSCYADLTTTPDKEKLMCSGQSHRILKGGRPEEDFPRLCCQRVFTEVFLCMDLPDNTQPNVLGIQPVTSMPFADRDTATMPRSSFPRKRTADEFWCPSFSPHLDGSCRSSTWRTI